MASDTVNNEVRAEREGAVMRIVLDAPKGNVLTAARLNAIARIIADAQGERELKLIRLEATGSHFSFGASIEEHKADRIKSVLPVLRGAIMTIASS